MHPPKEQAEPPTSDSELILVFYANTPEFAP